MQRCEDNVAARLNGNALQPLSDVSVTVTDDHTGLPAALYSDNGVTQVFQPLKTDDNGYYGFYAANGEYTLTFSGIRIATFTRKVVLNDFDDNPAVTKAELAAGSGASLVTFTQAGAGSTPKDLQTLLRDEVNIRSFGADATKTDAENRAALQAAITARASTGGVILVPPDISYGYKATDRTTWPSVVGATKPIIIEDKGPGKTYAGYPAAYDGCQVRRFVFTPQTTSPGQHDGNGVHLIGDWHPYHWVDNRADYSGARTASDNRRASYITGINGKAVWQWGQGSINGPLTDLQLANWHLRLYGSSVGSPVGDVDILIVDASTGNVMINTDSNASDSSFHVKSRTTGYYQGTFESKTTTAYLITRTSNGITDDAGLRNVGGDLGLWVSTQGDALTISKANRRVKTNQAFSMTKVAVAYAAAMTPDAQVANAFVITPSNGTAFTINAAANGDEGQEITVRIKNTFGALGAVTWAAAYRLAAWTQPANGFSRTIRFVYEAGLWIEIARTPADVPN